MNIDEIQQRIKARREGWHQSYTTEDCIDAVQTVAAQIDGSLTQTAYDTHKSHAQPASGTVRDRLDMRWSEIRKQYLQP